MPGHLPASSLPRPLLGEGWGNGTIRGEATFFIDAKGTDLAIADVDRMLPSSGTRDIAHAFPGGLDAIGGG